MVHHIQTPNSKRRLSGALSIASAGGIDEDAVEDGAVVPTRMLRSARGMERMPMTRPVLERMCPFFIVSDVARSIAFYRDMLGFQTWHQEPDDEPFFAVIGRDGAQLFLKAGDAAPMPNPTRDPAMRWDAYVLAYDPDAIATEFADRGVTFSVPLMDTHDTLRGFEIKDPDGYTLLSVAQETKRC
jgi:catechol 2,3-dioxygenase-like lactoylglutathione lyase family enzyme